MTEKTKTAATPEAGKAATAKKFNVVIEESNTALKFESVTARKVEAGDLLAAQRVSGQNQGNEFTRAIMAEVCKFDGKKLAYEDLQHLLFEDFLELQSQLMDLAWMGSDEQLSSFLERYG